MLMPFRGGGGRADDSTRRGGKVLVVGVVGCYFGMNARGGTEGVGRAATGSVVTSIFLVLVSDVVLVKIIQVLS
jgi:hypothetical protein